MLLQPINNIFLWISLCILCNARSTPAWPPAASENKNILPKLQALAAGAKACSFGRMFLFALSAGGQKGVEKVLQNMKDEIYRDMVLMGCKSLKDLDNTKLIYRK